MSDFNIVLADRAWNTSCLNGIFALRQESKTIDAFGTFHFASKHPAPKRQLVCKLPENTKSISPYLTAPSPENKKRPKGRSKVRVCASKTASGAVASAEDLKEEGAGLRPPRPIESSLRRHSAAQRRTVSYEGYADRRSA